MIGSMIDDIDAIITNKYCVPENLFVFRGHFPGNPVLPGIYSLELSIQHIASLLEQRISLHSVTRCKFVKPITPKMRIQVNATLLEREGSLQKAKVLLTDHEHGHLLTKLTLTIRMK